MCVCKCTNYLHLYYALPRISLQYICKSAIPGNN